MKFLFQKIHYFHKDYRLPRHRLNIEQQMVQRASTDIAMSNSTFATQIFVKYAMPSHIVRAKQNLK
jgi:hypothetical protein